MRPKTHYNQIGIGYDATRRADPHLSDRLHALLETAEHAACLDVACGSGNYTIDLAAKGIRMTGVDQSERMIAAARQKSNAVSWHIADVTRLPFAIGQFDGAVCTLAIHHFENLAGAFREVRRVLRRGKFVIFTATREQMRGYWLNEYFPIALDKSTEQMPDLRHVTAALREAGFENIQLEPYEIQPDLQDFFLYSGKHRPEIYLDPAVRNGISTFSLLADPNEIESGCRKLSDDISTGRIHQVMQSYLHSEGDYVFLSASIR